MRLKATGDVDATQLDRHSLTQYKEVQSDCLFARATHFVAMSNSYTAFVSLSLKVHLCDWLMPLALH